MSDLLELAERVEKEEGPDRKLDYAVHYAERGCPERADEIDYIKDPYKVSEFVMLKNGGGSTGYLPPRYTASLDAAMTLVPEGCGFLLTSTHMERWAQVVSESKLADGTLLVGPSLGSSKAATPALALTAAALRARAANKELEP